MLVLVFQDGRLEGLLDYTSPMALDTSMPILLFAVVFGLSTDYGVFLLQSIREARLQKAGPDAIPRGLATSGRAITAAALLFAVAMGAFAFSDLVFIKEVAVGTAVAVLVDAADRQDAPVPGDDRVARCARLVGAQVDGRPRLIRSG